MNTKSAWDTVLAEMEMAVSPSNFKTWIKPLAIEEGGEGVKLLCPSPYHQQIVENRYQGQIKKILEKVGGERVELEFEIRRGREKLEGEGESPLFATKITQEVRHNLNPRLRFETFVVGSSNNFAYAAAQGVAREPGTRHNPLFIYGGVGLGKTHLMHGLGHEIAQQHPDWEIMYISAETFGNDLIVSLRNKKTEAFKKKYRAPKVLLVDDVQFIAGKEYIQEEFFHTFNALHMSGRQIVLTSDQPPQEIARLEERLSSRFMGGVMVDVQPPDYETRVAILTQKCESLGIVVGGETLALMAEKAVSNIRELEGALQGILTRAAAEGGEVTNEVVRAYHGAETERRSRRVRPAAVISRCAKYFEYKPTELTGKSRKAPLVAARHTAMYLLYRELALPYEQIGRIFGGRDHTTAMHAVEKMEAMMKVNPAMAKTVADIKHGL